MNATLTQPRPRVKPSWSADYRPWHYRQGAGLLTLTDGKALHHYSLRRLPSDFGAAYRLEKFACELALSALQMAIHCLQCSEEELEQQPRRHQPNPRGTDSTGFVRFSGPELCPYPPDAGGG